VVRCLVSDASRRFDSAPKPCMDYLAERPTLYVIDYTLQERCAANLRPQLVRYLRTMWHVPVGDRVYLKLERGRRRVGISPGRHDFPFTQGLTHVASNSSPPISKDILGR